MAWPSSTEYFEAVQVPASFSDLELRQGQVAANAIGLPKACTGNFADVYQVCCAHNQNWAIKCFTREIPGLQVRYQLLSDHLRKIKCPFTVDFHYLEQGIRVRGQWYPMLKMRWVEGFTLNSFLRDQLDKPNRLRSMVLMWNKLAKNLRAGGIAHGDLQHGNVLLVPNADGTSLRLPLIDYDGMIVPALANQPSGEVGHPSYQYPERLAKGLYNPDVDRFSHLVICTALQCLIVGGKSLWDRFDHGDNLLFGKEDFADPAVSALFRELWQLPTPFAHSLVGHLILACKSPLAQVPMIDTLFLGEHTVVRLTAEQHEAIEQIMELKMAKPIATAQAVGAGEWWKSPAVTEKSTPATVAAEKASRASMQKQEEEEPSAPFGLDLPITSLALGLGAFFAFTIGTCTVSVTGSWLFVAWACPFAVLFAVFSIILGFIAPWNSPRDSIFARTGIFFGSSVLVILGSCGGFTAFWHLLR